MNQIQKNEYYKLKEQAKQGWLMFAEAIVKIREQRLYLVEYRTFEEFCIEGLNIAHSTARQIMSSSKVMQNLSSDAMASLPTSERQARPLTKLEPEMQREVWKEVTEDYQPNEITAKKISERVEQNIELNQAVKQVKAQNVDTIFAKEPLTEKEILEKAKEIKEQRSKNYVQAKFERLNEKTKTTPIPEDQKKMIEALERGETVVINMNKHHHVVKFAQDRGMYQRIDRYSEFGNPFHMGSDGDRDEVCNAFEKGFLPFKRSLHEKVKGLKGKALGCHCAPLRCHGDTLKKIADGNE